MATYCIGDVHGCYDELTQLLRVINYDPQHDHLWFVGDLVNRGPKSFEVLRLVSQLPNTTVVLGNHDLHLLNFYHGVVDFESRPLKQIFTVPDGPKLIEWLRMRPLLHYDQQYNCALVHAGIYPGWDLPNAITYAKEAEEALRGDNYIDFLHHMYGNQPSCWSDDLEGWDRLRFIINAFTRMRFCDQQGNLEFKHTGKINDAPDNHRPWFTLPWRKTKDTKILFGHWAALAGITNNPNALALDTGCAWGNTLTALRLDDGTRFSYPNFMKK